MSRSLLSTCSVAVAFAVSTAAPAVFAQDEPVVVVVKVYPGVGREDELQARYLKQAEFLRTFEPKASFRLHRSTKEPVTFLWYETYESQAALENHLNVAMPAFRKEFGATPEGLVARPSDSETYRELGK
jgi:quinol monooxygenase YgiN